MFNNIYSCLSNAYNYLDTNIRNNTFLYNMIPVLFQIISPTLFSNVPQLEGSKFLFKSIYDQLTNNNLNKNKNNSILNFVDSENMGSNNAKHEHQNIPIETKKKKQAIPKKTRDAVWVKYCGEKDEGVCYCCGKKVERYNAGWQCSHVHSEATGGEISIENLRVGCQGCNLSCGNQNLYAFIRDKNLKGPGSKNVNTYFKKNPSQINSKRTNNWGNNKKKKEEREQETKKNQTQKNIKDNTKKGWLGEWI